MQLIPEPRASVAEVHRAHGVNANQMFAWRRAFERGELTQPCSALLPASSSFVRDADLNEAAGAADTASMCSCERRWLR